jgi:hypothetical protein
MSESEIDQEFIFWPVGNGDSTTIVVNSDTLMQVDLNHLESADEDGDPHCPVVDELKKLLPEKDSKPYLAVFLLTHPDQDHCRGFGRLLNEVTIGEIWFTPRVFREFNKDLCDDAVAFRKEAKRRVKEMIDANGDVKSGDRVRIIGFDDILEEDDYVGFPSSHLTIPGTEITNLDGNDLVSIFRAFVHAPFKDDSAGDRNETSVALQVSLGEDDGRVSTLMFGDLSYPTLDRIFENSDNNDLSWDLLLAPHHCSKGVMYWAEEGEEEPTLQQSILDSIESVMAEDAYIIASSEPIPATNEEGDNPPHAVAKARYEEIAATAFLCTQENPNSDSPEPLIFRIRDGGIELMSEVAKSLSSLSESIRRARGSDTPPKDTVGFGA